MIWIFCFYLLSSLVTFGLYGLDKRRARKGGRRVPEKTLHLWELGAGWPGGFLAQRFFRHKTQKRSYRRVFAVIVLVHALAWSAWAYDRLSA